MMASGWLCLTVAMGLSPSPAAWLAYERYVTPTALPSLERQLVHTARVASHRKGMTLRYDWRLAEAASVLLSEAEADRPHGVDLDKLTEAAWQAGWTDGQLAAIELQAPASHLPKLLKKELGETATDSGWTHIGVASRLDAVSGRVTTIVALSRRLVALAPIPAQRKPCEPLFISGRLLDPSIKKVRLAVTEPSGQVVLSRNLPVTGRRFSAPFAAPARSGSQMVEIMVERHVGPEIAAQFPLFIGSSLHQGAPWHMDLKSRSKRHPNQDILALLQGLRASHRLPIVHPHPALMQVAKAHLHTMNAHKSFAHITAQDGSVVDRLRAIGQPFVHVVENLAEAQHPHELFYQWVQSPAHLANLLDPQVDAVGLALERSGDENTHSIMAVLVMARL